MARLCPLKLAQALQPIFATTFLQLIFSEVGFRNMPFGSAVLRLMVRLRGSFLRVRIIRLRMRLRLSVLGFAFTRKSKRQHEPDCKMNFDV